MASAKRALSFYRLNEKINADLAEPKVKARFRDIVSGSTARPFIALPGMSADRMKMAREAVMATMKDSDFLADVKKQKLDVVPEDGEQLAAYVKKIYATPKPNVDKIGELIK